MGIEIAPLPLEELEGFWAMGVPVEGVYVAPEELGRAAAEGRVLEAVCFSEMGTAETYWRKVGADGAWERKNTVVYPPGETVNETPYEEWADNRDVAGVLWEPFYRLQAWAAGDAVATESRGRVAGALANVLERVEHWRGEKGGEITGEALVAEVIRSLALTGELPERAGVAKGQTIAALLVEVMESAERAKMDGTLQRELRMGMLRHVVSKGRGKREAKVTTRVTADLPQEASLARVQETRTSKAVEPAPRNVVVAIARGQRTVMAEAPPMDIEACARCVGLPQVQTVNYEKSDVRPPAWGEMEVLGRERREESTNVWDEWFLVRCPACWTAYGVHRSKDEGHSFMDPTHDWERVVRLTPTVAGAVLAKYTAGGGVYGLDVKGRSARLLRTVMNGGMAQWHVRKYACEAVIHAEMADGGDAGGILQLLGHPEVGVRVEAVEHLLSLANRWEVEAGTDEMGAGLEAAVKAFLAANPVMDVLAEALREPPAPSLEKSCVTDEFLESDTHQLALRAMALATRLGVGMDEAAVGLAAEILLSPVPGRRRSAADALHGVLQGGGNYRAIIAAALERLSPGERALPEIRMLISRVSQR